MRHRNLRNKLHGSSSQTRAMFNNMLASLIQTGRVKTTESRARILRSLAEKVVTRAASLGDLLLKDRANLPAEDKLRLVHAMRMVRRRIKGREMMLHLFAEVAPRFIGRPGGYTRILKTGFRKGDGAPMAILEFVDAEMPAREGAPQPKKEKKGPLGFLRGKGKKEKA